MPRFVNYVPTLTGNLPVFINILPEFMGHLPTLPGTLPRFVNGWFWLVLIAELVRGHYVQVRGHHVVLTEPGIEVRGHSVHLTKPWVFVVVN